MSKSRLEKYYDQERSLRLEAESAHRVFITARSKLNSHLRRLQTSYHGTGAKRKLDGRDI